MTSTGMLPDSTPSLQHGSNVVWYYNGTDTDQGIRQKADLTFNYARSLHCNAIAISFPFYMEHSAASTVHGGSATPSPEQLAIVVDVAERYGLRVNIRPLLDEDSFRPDGWRGTILPEDRIRWFASYGSFIHPYLVMAQAVGAAQFEIGAELNSLSVDDRWEPLVSQARTVFHGTIGFSNNWDVFHVGRLGPASVDSQGLDAYFPVSIGDDATVDQLAAAWIDWLNGVPKHIDLRQVVLTEVGIAAQPGSYIEPNAPGDESKPIDRQIQQRWFAAACRAMRYHRMAGIYFWMLDLNHPPGTFDSATGDPLSFVGRGDSEITSCFSLDPPMNCGRSFSA